MNHNFIKKIKDLLEDYCRLHYQYSSLDCIIYENKNINLHNNQIIIKNNLISLKRIVENLYKKLEQVRNKIKFYLKGEDKIDVINNFLNDFDDNHNITVNLTGGLKVSHYAYDLLNEILYEQNRRKCGRRNKFGEECSEDAMDCYEYCGTCMEIEVGMYNEDEF